MIEILEIKCEKQIVLWNYDN